jgi:hypothetical protein
VDEDLMRPYVDVDLMRGHCEWGFDDWINLDFVIGFFDEFK